MRDVECLQCKTADPITELAAADAVRKQDAVNPGVLAYYHCPSGRGFHLTLAGKRDDARRPKDIA
jgi:hypothetical protein